LPEKLKQILNKTYKHIVFIIVALISWDLAAVSAPPQIQRACLDATTSVLSVFFKPTTDGCGSFVEYVLYGRDNSSNPFVYLNKSNIINSSIITAPLPNKKAWQVYIVARYACNGTDTFSSNYVFIDNTPPAMLNLDSVSVDLQTQQILAGWSKAPENDVMGYSVFKVDPGTGNNILIKDTFSTNYIFTTSTFNSNNTGNRIAIAVFDSCNNGGVICNFHSPILASYSMAANANYRCTKKFTFNWSPYIGWTADHYSVYADVSPFGEWIYLGDVSGTSYTFDIPLFNQNYRFFVRAHKNAGNTGITSSSNIIAVSLPGHPKPTSNEIGHVSVVGNNLEITGMWGSLAPGYTAKLYYSLDGIVWNLLQSTKNTFQLFHTGLNTNKTQYYYRNIVFNPCGEACDTSTTHSNIVLKRDMFLLLWNPYKPWQLNVLNNLNKKNNINPYWQTEYKGENTDFILSDTSQGFCYRVKAIKNNFEDSSFSNIVCLVVKDTTLIPSGFNPEGKYPFFRIVNPNIEPGQATMSIFDRWGGMLWQGDALQGWNGKSGEDFLPMGLYIYKVAIKRPIKNELFAGTVLLIK
jgi:hypothetical protein